MTTILIAVLSGSFVGVWYILNTNLKFNNTELDHGNVP